MGNFSKLIIFISFFYVLSSVYGYYNITNINTTLILNLNQSAHVVEVFTVYVSNASLSSYQQTKDAIGITLSDWQKIIYNGGLTQHILGSGHSVYDFAFLPGPLVSIPGGGYATLTMNYYVKNATSIKNIAPRKFEYTLNDSIFNFQAVQNGQILPSNLRFNIIIPKGSQIVTLYPLSDSPKPNFIENYTNDTIFSWYTGEPLSQFSFQYVVTESPQTEVVDYFNNLYKEYTFEIYIISGVILIVIIVYIYKKTFTK